jgi:hypothetical protein
LKHLETDANVNFGGFLNRTDHSGLELPGMSVRFSHAISGLCTETPGKMQFLQAAVRDEGFLRGSREGKFF